MNSPSGTLDLVISLARRFFIYFTIFNKLFGMRYFKDKHFMIISINLLGIFFFYGYQGKINIIEKKQWKEGDNL